MKWEEEFDARGTKGKEPSARARFTLAPEEMGRQAGSKGEFTAPVSQDYAYQDPEARHTAEEIAKKKVYETAKSIYDNTSKRKMPRAVTAMVDRTTGKTYIGVSKGIKGIDELEKEIVNRLPEHSLEGWATYNCAEVDTLKKAFADNVKPENLVQHTVMIDKHTGEITDYPRCKNCEITTHDIKTPSDGRK